MPARGGARARATPGQRFPAHWRPAAASTTPILPRRLGRASDPNASIRWSNPALAAGTRTMMLPPPSQLPESVLDSDVHMIPACLGPGRVQVATECFRVKFGVRLSTARGRVLSAPAVSCRAPGPASRLLPRAAARPPVWWRVRLAAASGKTASRARKLTLRPCCCCCCHHHNFRQINTLRARQRRVAPPPAPRRSSRLLRRMRHQSPASCRRSGLYRRAAGRIRRSR